MSEKTHFASSERLTAMTDFDSTPLTSAALATLLDLSVRRVQQLACEGLLARGADGKFPVGPSVRAYLKVRADPQEAEWRRRHERAMALLAEHKLKKLDAEYNYPLALWGPLMDVWVPHMHRMLGWLQSVPGVVAGLSDPLDPYVIQEILLDHTHPELDETIIALMERTPEPFRARFREVREADEAALAEIRAADAARAAHKASLDRAVAREVLRVGKYTPDEVLGSGWDVPAKKGNGNAA